MSVITSSSFAASTHGGANWREAAKQVLDDLSDVQTDDQKFTLGFLYVTDHLANDVGAILNLFQSVLGIDQWVGSVGIGVCGQGRMYSDEVGISAMICNFENDSFRLLGGTKESKDSDADWVKNNEPMLILAHAHPADEIDIKASLQTLENDTGGFVLGGLSLCRPDKMPDTPLHDHQAVNVKGGIDAAAFSSDINVMSMMTQGCKPLGAAHTITQADGMVMRSLNNLTPQTIFEDDLRKFAKQKIGRNPDDIVVESPETLPQEFQEVFTGEVLAAFPLTDTDTGDYLVRPVLGMNEDGSIMVQHECVTNERVMFVHRDDTTVREGLSAELLKLRKRIEQEHVAITPHTIKGGIYISCAARAFTDDGKPNISEVDLIGEILGEFPLCGFFSGGEIKSHRLYGFTGILILFL